MESSWPEEKAVSAISPVVLLALGMVSWRGRLGQPGQQRGNRVSVMRPKRGHAQNVAEAAALRIRRCCGGSQGGRSRSRLLASRKGLRNPAAIAAAQPISTSPSGSGSRHSPVNCGQQRSHCVYAGRTHGWVKCQSDGGPSRRA